MNFPPTLPSAPQEINKLIRSNKAAWQLLTVRSNCRKAVGGKERGRARCPGIQANCPTHWAPSMPYTCQGWAGDAVSSLQSVALLPAKSPSSALLTPAPTASCRNSCFDSLFHMPTCAGLVMLHRVSFRGPLPVLCLSHLLCLSTSLEPPGLQRREERCGSGQHHY